MKKRYLWMLLTLAILMLTGCGDEEKVTEIVKEPEPEPIIYYNPVTNLPVDEEKIRVRPIAVMMNNVKKAMPHAGISKADICFELPAEGNTNRIMAVFYDYEDIPQIGTVRSAREYFVDYARSLDALYLHFGGSPSFYTFRSQIMYDDLDGINSEVEKLLYWRDEARWKANGKEHSVLTSGEKIIETIEELDVRGTLEEDYSPYFWFVTTGSAVQGELSADIVTVPYSNYISPVFYYDEASGLYKRFQYGEPHVDAAYNNEQVAVKNLLILKTDVNPIPGDDALRVDVRTTGEGTGYYVTDGFARSISWRKPDGVSPVMICNPLGNEIQLNNGKVWVCILENDPVIEPGALEEEG